MDALDKNGLKRVWEAIKTRLADKVDKAEHDKKIDILTEILLGMDTTVIRNASGNPVEIDDGADNIPVKNLCVEIPVTQSGGGIPYPPGGNVNLLPYPYAFYNPSTRTINGVTFTDHGDGRITANGTASAQIDYRISEDRASQLSENDTNNLFTLPPGDYILSDGVPSHSADSYFVFINVHKTDNSQQGFAQSYGSGKFTIGENDDTFQNFRIAIQIKSGVTINNVTFYPMIRKADITDETWSPYSNVHPSFIGFDGVTVTQTGQNLFAFGITAFDVSIALRQNPLQRLILSAVTGDVNAIKCNYNGGSYSMGYIEIAGIDGTRNYNISYTISENTTNYSPFLRIYTEQSNKNKLVLLVSGNNNANITPNSQYFVLSDIQIAPGSMPYEPYQAQAVTVSTGAAGTVYGGNLNVTTGVLTVTHGHIAAYVGETVPDGWGSSTGELSDSAEIVYPLETPVTYQLTPQELKTLPGVNYLTSDAGNIALKYHANASLLYHNLSE